MTACEVFCYGELGVDNIIRLPHLPTPESAALVYWYSQTPKTSLTADMLGGAHYLVLDLYGGDKRLAASAPPSQGEAASLAATLQPIPGTQ
jgi:hypothetical protein